MPSLQSVANFNSIKVQLKLCHCAYPCFFYNNFNSIKVQLKLDREGLCVGEARQFQFHKGTIKTHK